MSNEPDSINWFGKFSHREFRGREFITCNVEKYLFQYSLIIYHCL